MDVSCARFGHRVALLSSEPPGSGLGQDRRDGNLIRRNDYIVYADYLCGRSKEFLPYVVKQPVKGNPTFTLTGKDVSTAKIFFTEDEQIDNTTYWQERTLSAKDSFAVPSDLKEKTYYLFFEDGKGRRISTTVVNLPE